MRNRSSWVICISLGILALPAWGDLVVSNGAGASLLTAQDLSLTTVTEISGNFGLNSNDPAVNLFKISVNHPSDFSARTSYTGAFGVPDTELFLFNSAGLGVYFNDDISPANTQSCLPSSNALVNSCDFVSALGPVVPGIYYLGIAYSANGPVDASGNEIFTNSSSTDVVGPNAGAGPLAGWDGNSFTQPDTDLTGYDVVVSGTEPEPSSFFVVIGLLVSAMAYWRRVTRRRHTMPL